MKLENGFLRKLSSEPSKTAENASSSHSKPQSARSSKSKAKSKSKSKRSKHYTFPRKASKQPNPPTSNLSSRRRMQIHPLRKYHTTHNLDRINCSQLIENAQNDPFLNDLNGRFVINESDELFQNEFANCDEQPSPLPTAFKKNKNPNLCFQHLTQSPYVFSLKSLSVGMWASAFHIKDQIFLHIASDKFVFVVVHEQVGQSISQPESIISTILNKLHINKKQFMKRFGKNSPFAQLRENEQNVQEAEFHGVIALELKFADMAGFEYYNPLFYNASRVTFEGKKITKYCFDNLDEFFEFYKIPKYLNSSQQNEFYIPYKNKDKEQIKINHCFPFNQKNNSPTPPPFFCHPSKIASPINKPFEPFSTKFERRSFSNACIASPIEPFPNKSSPNHETAAGTSKFCTKSTPTSEEDKTPESSTNKVKARSSTFPSKPKQLKKSHTKEHISTKQEISKFNPQNKKKQQKRAHFAENPKTQEKENEKEKEAEIVTKFEDTVLQEDFSFGGKHVFEEIKNGNNNANISEEYVKRGRIESQNSCSSLESFHSMNESEKSSISSCKNHDKTESIPLNAADNEGTDSSEKENQNQKKDKAQEEDEEPTKKEEENAANIKNAEKEDNGKKKQELLNLTVICYFDDPILPYALRDLINKKKNQKLMNLYETSIPGWSIFMPAYGFYYRPWMRYI
jgi:hypothetical protein